MYRTKILMESRLVGSIFSFFVMHKTKVHLAVNGQWLWFDGIWYYLNHQDNFRQ